MFGLLECVLSIAVISAALALVVFAATQLWRNPHVARALWLLVLFKLITPPLIIIPLPFSIVPLALEFRDGRAEGPPFQEIESVSSTSDSVQSQTMLQVGEQSQYSAKSPAASLTSAFEPIVNYATATKLSADRRLVVSWKSFDVICDCLVACWVCGSLIFVIRTVSLHRRFLRILSRAHAANAELSRVARRLARQMRIARVPAVLVTTARVPPLLLSHRFRPIILLPQQLLDQFTSQQREAVLAHELSHFDRYDHLARKLEMLVLAIHWWNPIAWWASRELRRSQETCCDASVVATLPRSRRCYAETLLSTIEFLTETGAVLPATGSPFGKSVFTRRIEMILQQDIPKRAPGVAWAVLLLTALVVLPVAAQGPDGSAPSNYPLVNQDQPDRGFVAGEFKNSSKYSDSDFKSRKLRWAEFSYSVIASANFRGADLRDADFQYSVASDADFTDADLRRAKLNYTVLSDARFEGAKLEGADLDHSVLTSSTRFSAKTTYDVSTRFRAALTLRRPG